MTITKNIILPLASIALMFALGACQKRVTPTSVCNDISGFNMTLAIEDAKENMRNGCSNGNLQYLVSALVKVGQQNPSPDNRTAIREFIMWNANNGYAPKMQAIHEFKKYFGRGIRVNDAYSVNAQLETNPAALERELRQALEHQRQGSLCTNDKAAYAFAVTQFNSMITLMDAASMAREGEGL